MHFSLRLYLGISILLSSVLMAENFIEIPIALNSDPSHSRELKSRWGLALSGGGARGLAQIGALKVLEENGIQIKGIAGTSIGAVLGGLYSAGLTATELESLAYAIRWDEIMQNRPPRKQLFLTQKAEKDQYLIQLRFKGGSLDLPSAFSSGQKLNNMITEHVLNTPHPFPEDFDKLPIQFRAISTDLVSGEKCIIKSGSLIDAMRASMAIPLLFNPVEKEGALLVDGGLVQNMPVDETRDLNVDWVIAIDTSSKLRSLEDLDAAWEIADQATTIMQQEQTIAQLESADIQIQPELTGISNTDFEVIEQIIKAGEDATKILLPEILKMDSLYSQPAQWESYYIKNVVWHDSSDILPVIIKQEFSNQLPCYISKQEIQTLVSQWIQTSKNYNIKAFIDTSSKSLHFQIKEPSYISKIRFSGNTILSDSILHNIIFDSENQQVTRSILQTKLNDINKIYRSKDYPLFHVDTLAIYNDSAHVKINEGEISSIKINGRERTKKLVVLREMKTHPGSLFQSSRIKEDIQNIYSTGLFEGIGFNINKYSKDHQLKIQVIEQGSFLIRAGIRYDNTREMKGFLQFVEDNFNGTGTKVSLLGLTGNKNNKLKMCVRSDRFFETMFTYKFCGSYEISNWKYYNDFESLGPYDYTKTHFSFSLGQQMQRLGTFSATIQSENVTIDAENNEDIPVGTYLIRNISIQSEVDTRDQRSFPNSGKYNLIYYETGGKLLGSEISYVKICSSTEYYYTFLKRLNFHHKIAWGSTDNGTPFPKKFTLGGYSSFIGLQQSQVVGKRFLLLSGELRYKLPWPRFTDFYLTGKYDFGGIWEDYNKIETKDFIHGLGTALSIKSPMGPFRLAYGKTSNGHSRIYVSLGYAF